MRIAIHNSRSGFHPHWITYCKKNEISYKLVDCYDSNIIEQLEDCEALMWHHHHTSVKDVLLAKQLLFALEQSGKLIFPDFNTGWHFDDKVGQKYLLEALNLPLVPSYVFYDKQRALKWISSIEYPKVWKLRGGAGASNVRLVKNIQQATSLVNQAFGKGFKPYNALSSLQERLRKYKQGNANFREVLKGIYRLLQPPFYSKVLGKEIGYIYFQDFIPNNDSDYRVIVIGEKAIAIKRMVRQNDFRASGSGNFYYNEDLFGKELIQLAFQAKTELKADCCAFDFVYDNGKPLIVEVSFGFASSGYEACPGYWDTDLNFHESYINPYDWMVELLKTKIIND